MGFFEHHYLDKNLDNDYEQDKKLPFRTYDFSTVSSPLVFTFQGIEDFIPKKPKIVIFEKKAHYFYKKRFYIRVSLLYFSATRIFNVKQ